MSPILQHASALFPVLRLVINRPHVTLLVR